MRSRKRLKGRLLVIPKKDVEKIIESEGLYTIIFKYQIARKNIRKKVFMMKLNEDVQGMFEVTGLQYRRVRKALFGDTFKLYLKFTKVKII